MNTIETEESLGLTFCVRYPLVIERGNGLTVWTEDGVRFLDFTSGWGVTSLGHAHPLITRTITEQAGRLLQCPNSGFLYSPTRAAALRELNKVLPEHLVSSYFVNSGAEANDAVIKLARKISGRSKIVSTLNSFHGRTLNTLAVSSSPANAASFSSLDQAAEFVEFGDLHAMEQVIDNDTAAVIVEPIQGEGGARVPPSNYLISLSKLCKRRGVFLIVDEIQTGFLRTGSFFAFQHNEASFDFDFLTMGKGMAGGFPIAAFAVSQRIKDQIEIGDHGGTFCGNPLGCAVVAEVIPYLARNEFAKSIAAKGQYMENFLLSLEVEFSDLLVEVRGRGMLWGIQLKSQPLVDTLTNSAIDRGLLIVPTRNAVVRLIPPLTVSLEELVKGLSLFKDSLADLSSAA